ncbi:MAG: glycosyltransferase family 4 protein [Candidatus Magasanikbacteria bacterium]|nr:glycosyltransferase family 4 protein [Candidatus Magasanikbacteria bacterium]
MNKKIIALFFTYGVSLARWEALGILERELALYKRLTQQGYRFFFFTYGRNDGKYAASLARLGITVVPKNSAMPNVLYSLLLPWLHRRELRTADILKTNQMLGSWTAVIAKWLFHKPLIVRAGYSFHQNAMAQSAWKGVIAKAIEHFAIGFVDCVVVTTDAERQRLAHRQHRLVVISNYVDVERFQKNDRIRSSGGPMNIIYIGRLAPEKNLKSFLLALKGVSDVAVTIVGDGDERYELEQIVAANQLAVRFVGRLQHDVLPPYLQAADLFVLPSLYEGQPKALLEAMACGVPVLASAVRGIKDVVTHGVTAYLVPPTIEGMTAGLRTLCGDRTLRAKLAENGRRFILENCTLAHIVGQEARLYESVYGDRS